MPPRPATVVANKPLRTDAAIQGSALINIHLAAMCFLINHCPDIIHRC